MKKLSNKNIEVAIIIALALVLWGTPLILGVLI